MLSQAGSVGTPAPTHVAELERQRALLEALTRDAAEESGINRKMIELIVEHMSKAQKCVVMWNH